MTSVTSDGCGHRAGWDVTAHLPAGVRRGVEPRSARCCHYRCPRLVDCPWNWAPPRRGRDGSCTESLRRAAACGCRIVKSVAWRVVDTCPSWRGSWARIRRRCAGPSSTGPSRSHFPSSIVIVAAVSNNASKSGASGTAASWPAGAGTPRPAVPLRRRRVLDSRRNSDGTTLLRGDRREHLGIQGRLFRLLALTRQGGVLVFVIRRRTWCSASASPRRRSWRPPHDW